MENYDYIGDLGSGSYGFVWKCLQRSTGRIVAVKGFKLAHTDKKFLDQAIREVRMLRASCDHPNVVQLLEAFRSSSGRVYMVFEFVERCLSAELHKRFTCGLPAAQTRMVLWQLLCAVAHLHSKKIIHRDIKPGNLLLASDGILKLCDFGFARTTRGEPYQPDRFSSYVVTRWYRSPEMLVSDLYSAASDVWSLGCTFAEIATGRPLFPGTSSLDQLWRIMRCLGSLPASQTERFAAAATAAGLPEPPPPPPRGKSLWQRLPELEAGLLDVVQACLRLDPMQRPTAAQLLQMPYFTDAPRFLAGSPLEKLYSEYGTGASQRLRTPSGRLEVTAATNSTTQQQQQQAAAATRGVAVQVMRSDELIREATGGKGRAANSVGDGDPRRPVSVSLSAVAASLLGELPAAPGGNGTVQLLPLVAPVLAAAAAVTSPPLPPPPPPPPPLPGLDAIGPRATAEAAPAAALARSGGVAKPLPLASSLSSKNSLSANVGGLMGQLSSPAPAPQPPAVARVHSGASPRALPPLTQNTSRRRLVSISSIPAPAAMAAPAAAVRQVASELGVSERALAGGADASRAADGDAATAMTLGERPSTCEGAMERPVGRPITAKRLAASQGVQMGREPGAGSAATARAKDANGRVPSKVELMSPLGKGSAASEEMLLATDGAVDPRVDFGRGVSSGLGLIADGGDDIHSDGDGHISEDDELMEYFAARSAGSGRAGGGAGGSQRATGLPGNPTGVTVASLSRAGSGGGGAGAAAAAAGGSSVSMRRLPLDGLHAGVQGVHHGLYGSRQASGAAGGSGTSLNGALPMNRRVAAMVMRTGDLSGGAAAAASASVGGAASPQQVQALKQAKRATVGSYLSVSPSVAPTPGEPPLPEAAAAAGAAARPRTAGVSGAAATDVGLYRAPGGGGAGVPMHPVSHGALPALQTHHTPHVMTTMTGTGLASTSNAPHANAIYGRTSVPIGGYALTGVPYNVAGSGRRRALSRQGSVVFNQLMYDALPEIGTPGGAPDVPAGTPPRRRIVMSGFTPCRTAAARAAAEGMPPAAAMAAVLGDALQSTTTDLSVAYSPIHLGRSTDPLSPDRDSGPACDAAPTAGGAAVTAAMAMRRLHRRQGSIPSSAEPPGGSVGGATAATIASAAGYHAYRFAADQASAIAVNGGDAGLLLGSSAPNFYHHRLHQRHAEPGAAAISSGAGAGPVAIAGAAAAARRIPFALGSAGAGGASSIASGSPGTSIGPAYATPLSGARGFQQTPLTPAARSRLASGHMTRDGQPGSGLLGRDGEPEATQSTEFDPLGAWAGTGCSPAAGGAGAGAGAGGQVLQQQQPQALAAQGHTALPPPPLMRGRLGRWASGLIDSLPEDREVLHVAYGDWHGSYGDGSTGPGAGDVDDAIQMLAPMGSADWAGCGGGQRGTVASPLPGLTSPRAGPSGPWPPSGEPRTPRSGSSVDRRAAAAAVTAAAGAPPPLMSLKSSPRTFPRSSSPSPIDSPHVHLGRSRRNLQTAAADAASANPNAGLSRALSSFGSHPAEPSESRERPASSGGAGGNGTRSGGGASSTKSSGKWPRAKAFLGGRLISSLVRKFKEQTSEKDK